LHAREGRTLLRMVEEYGHPASWRLFRAHPALGLDEMDQDVLWPPDADELGVAWLALDSTEQRRREADLVAEIERIAKDPDSGWDLKVEMRQDGTRGVRMDRWKAPALERELLDRVWEAAHARDGAGSPGVQHHRVDRTVRAHVVVSWDRHAWRAFIAAMALAGLLGLHPWGDWSVGAVAVRLAIAVVVLVALEQLVVRWYRRTDR